MQTDIRIARASDIDHLVAIEDAVFLTDRISRRSFNRLVSAGTAAVLVAESSTGLMGYCVVLFRRGSDAARLYSIATSSGREGAGFGSALLGAAEGAARGRGSRSLRLEVRADNQRARALYERSGYRRIGDVPGYYADGTAAFRYVKQLQEEDGESRAGSRPGRERRSG